MGALLSKSYELSDEVYLAMLSRGFRGEVHLLDTFRWQMRDSIWLAIFLGVAALAAWLGRF